MAHQRKFYEEAKDWGGGVWVQGSQELVTEDAMTGDSEVVNTSSQSDSIAGAQAA